MPPRPAFPSYLDESDFEGLTPGGPAPGGWASLLEDDFAGLDARPQPSGWDAAILAGLRTIPAIAGSWIGGAGGAVGGSAVPVAGTAAGGVAGASAGGAIGSGVGELAAQGYEWARGLDDDFNLTQVGAQAGIGAIPFASPFRAVRGVGGAALRSLANAAQGAVLGGAAAPITSAIDRRALPTWDEAVEQGRTGALYGGAFGGAASLGLEGVSSYLGRRAATRAAEIDAAYDPNFDARLDELLAGQPRERRAREVPYRYDDLAATEARDRERIDQVIRDRTLESMREYVPGDPGNPPPPGAIPPPDPMAALLPELAPIGTKRRYDVEDLFTGLQNDDPLRTLTDADFAGLDAGVPAPAGVAPDAPVPAAGLLGGASDVTSPGRPRLDQPLTDPALEDQLGALFADAADQGWDGDLAELRAVFADRLAEARQVNDDLASIASESQGTDPVQLLRDIAAAGGLSDDFDAAGEIAWLKEAQDQVGRVSRKGKRYAAPAFGSVAGVPGVFRRGGLTLDGMTEQLNANYGPRRADLGMAAEPRFRDLNDLIDALTDAVSTINAGTKRVGGPSLQSTLEGALGVKPGNRWWETPELIDDLDTMVNASGESAASAEALSRQRGMQDRGEAFVVFDRAGNERPLLGPDAVDYVPRPGETYAVRTLEGVRILDDQGGRVPVTDAPALPAAHDDDLRFDPIELEAQPVDPHTATLDDADIDAMTRLGADLPSRAPRRDFGVEIARAREQFPPAVADDLFALPAELKPRPSGDEDLRRLLLGQAEPAIETGQAARTLPREQFVEQFGQYDPAGVRDPFAQVPEAGAPGVQVETLPQAIEGVPPQQAVVFRDETGAARGVLRVPIDAQGQADAPVVFVDPAFRRQGIATALYDVAERAGLDLSQSGRSLTSEGAQLFHSRANRPAAPEVIDQIPAGDQRRLPGDVGAVRDQEWATPAEDLPFALERETAERPQPKDRDLLAAFIGDEEGSVPVPAAIRAGAGAAGAVYGAATGEDTEDRLLRAALFGGAGLVGATALTRGMTRPRGAGTPPTGRERGALTEPTQASPAPTSQQGRTRGLPKYAHNINLQRIDSPDEVKRVILETSRTYRGQLETSRRGRIAQETTRQMAAELGMTPAELLQRRRGQAFNAEEALAARDLNVASARRVWDAAQVVREAGEGATAQQLNDLIGSLNQHVAIQSQIAGLTAEAGRALAQFRMMATGDVPLQQLNDLIALEGGPRKLEALADRLTKLDPTNLRAVNQFVREARKATTADKVYEAWVNALLSGPVTHIANTISNGLTAGTMPIEKGIAASLDAVRALGTGKPRERFFSEASDAFIGLWKGLVPGLRAGLEAFRTEQPQFGRQRLDVGQKGEQAIGGTVGRLTRVPSRALQAEDEFFKNILYSADIHSRAVRQALQEGKRGRDVGSRVAEILQNPTTELTAKSQKEALYRTFNTPLQSEAERALFTLRRNVPGARWIVPFLRTPVNIAKFGLERTPLSVGQVLTRWGRGELKGGDLSDAAAKTVFGTMLAMGVAAAYKNGLVTGGGSPNRAQHQTQATVRPDYSVKVGNQWVSYQRTEPLGIVLGLTADVMELGETASEEQVSKLLAAFSRNLQSKTFLSGVTDFFNVLTDHDRYGDQWVRRMAGSVVPTAVAQVARTTDPVYRKTGSVSEAIRARVPGQGTDLPPVVDVFGRPITSEETAGERFLSPFRRRGVKSDPLVDEMTRLGLFIQTPSDRLELPDDRELSNRDKSTLQQARGQMVRRRLETTMQRPAYRGASDERKRERLEQAIQAARAEVSQRARRATRKGQTLTLESLLGLE